MSNRTIIIYSAGQVDEAMLVKQLLEERDIEAFIENLSLQGGLGELPPGVATNPRVRVDEADEEKAREVVKAFEHQQKTEADGRPKSVAVPSPSSRSESPEGRATASQRKPSG